MPVGAIFFRIKHVRTVVIEQLFVGITVQEKFRGHTNVLLDPVILHISENVIL